MRLRPLSLPGFTSDRSWTFDVSGEALWRRVTATEEYPRWWPWLTEFDADAGFRRGAAWSCTVEPPLPYRVRFVLALETVRPAELVHARVSGDIRGEAELTIDADRAGAGCVARLRSDLAPANPLLRGVAVAAYPLVLWGHDWVLDSGQRQFVQAAFPDLDPDAPTSA